MTITTTTITTTIMMATILGAFCFQMSVSQQNYQSSIGTWVSLRDSTVVTKLWDTVQ